eukprot:scaffold32196_cov48-Phaeocystis_antarctica.AAC.2
MAPLTTAPLTTALLTMADRRDEAAEEHSQREAHPRHDGPPLRPQARRALPRQRRAPRCHGTYYGYTYYGYTYYDTTTTAPKCAPYAPYPHRAYIVPLTRTYSAQVHPTHPTHTVPTSYLPRVPTLCVPVAAHMLPELALSGVPTTHH